MLKELNETFSQMHSYSDKKFVDCHLADTNLHFTCYVVPKKKLYIKIGFFQVYTVIFKANTDQN